MKRRWDSSHWKKSTKLLLGLTTAWPYIYLSLFIVGVFSLTLFANPKRQGYCGDTGVIQLQQKIRNGEVKELIVRPTEIFARSKEGTCEYRVFIPDKISRDEVLRTARERDAHGVTRVATISEEPEPNVSPIVIGGFVTVFVVHMLTIVLLLGLITIYVVLIINNEQLDQTMKIVWIVLLALLTMLSMPVYWYLYVWRKPAAQLETSPNQNLAAP